MRQWGWCFLCFFLISVWGGENAYGEDKNWSVGFLFGMYDPSLETLNDVIADSGKGIVQDPNFLLPRSQEFPANERNISTSAIEGNLSFGLEVERLITDRHSLLFTLSVWNGESIARDEIPLFLRADQTDPFIFPREARYNVQLNQFWLSWRYHLLKNPEVGRVFLNIGIAGFALADVTLDSLVKVVCPDSNPTCVPDGGFASVSSTEASGLGFSTNFGLGGEYFITNWLSVGANVNYVIGEVDQLNVDRIFTSGFEQFDEVPPESLFGTVGIPTPPPVPETGNNLTFADIRINPNTPNTEEIRQQSPVKLELEGLSAVFLFRVHF
ncbi:MAG TPA: hypothetical protein VGB26_10325 [Nitrospiria bacterium]